MSGLVAAKLADPGIGPLPICAGCGERLTPGAVLVHEEHPRAPWDLFSPFVQPGESLYHVGCAPS